MSSKDTSPKDSPKRSESPKPDDKRSESPKSSPKGSESKNSRKGSDSGKVSQKSVSPTSPGSPTGEKKKKIGFWPDSVEDDEFGDTPDFIYGGPFIKQKRPSTFLDIETPVNMPQSGTYRGCQAYNSLKDRLPIILTKVIDVASRKGGGGQFVEKVSKLKSDLVTNKKYAPFTEDSEEAKKWNNWLKDQTVPNYFGNTWCFTECYVYRKIIEALKLSNQESFDPFEDVKRAGVKDNIEPMCVVADRLMSEFSAKKDDKAKRKEEFGILLKIALWANKCDMSMSSGEPVTFKAGPPPPVKNPPPPAKSKKKATGPPPYVDPGFVDPFAMIALYKLNTLTDDSNKAFDLLCKRGDKIRGQIEKAKPDHPPPPPPPPKPPKGAPPPPEPVDKPPEPPKIPCPAKLCVPSHVFLDIVCDNAGYEIFADLCLAHYIIVQELADKVRFHLKKYPWFVSDATPKDFHFVIDSCRSASYNKTASPPAPPPPTEGETAEPAAPKVITSTPLNELGNTWAKYLEDGTFIIMTDDYWCYPHPYKDMKKLDPNMYRKLQYAAMIVFKGDLNYRKLLADRNTYTLSTLEPNLQDFHPAPVLALRTVKSEIICGLESEEGQPCKADVLHEQDPGWRTTGNYGTIQLCKKAEPFKPSVFPCLDYGTTCFGYGCPTHTDI